MESVKLPVAIRVQYLPGHPGISWAPDVAENDIWIWFSLLVLGLFATILVGVIVVFVFNDVWFEKRLKQPVDLPAYPKGWH